MDKKKLIAFYLPQFYPIPENDEWWGKGFTEWLSVASAKPRFKGHHQPQLPADLGFYDLRLKESRIAQAELAQKYGIAGFCYYHYWFNGKMLLEKPFNDVLASGEPEFPFCLCWANENWTRGWDGLDKEILMHQNYDKYNSVEHISWLIRAFSDKRYIKIGNKPLFLIYRADLIPDLKNILLNWRQIADKKGLQGLYFCAVKSFHNSLNDEDIVNLGFDAIVEFYPHRDYMPRPKIASLPKLFFSLAINKLISLFGLENTFRKLPVTFVYDYVKMVDKIMSRKPGKFKTFPCVIPNWDNTPRKRRASVIQNNDPLIYKKWLKFSLEKIKDYNNEEKIVFINAWNEWGEGCHLEPDYINGKIFLEIAREVINS